MPLILKTAASGYDGKGQILVNRASELSGAWANLGRAPCVAEAWVDFAAEVSVVVARGCDGQAVCYPVALNRHERHILDSTVAPAPVGPIVAQEARRLALCTAAGPGHRRRSDRRVLRDIGWPASGQRDCSPPAQFRTPDDRGCPHQPVRAAGAGPLRIGSGPTDLVMPAAMVNLLGDLWCSAGGEPRWDAAFRADPGASIHLYGKRTPAAGRKMGHLTVLDPDPETAVRRAMAVRSALVGGRRSAS